MAEMTDDRMREDISHITTELGLWVSAAPDGVAGRAELVPELLVPGTPYLRTSVLAIWSDILTGLLAANEVRPRVPVTLQLDVELYEPGPGSGQVEAVARTVKSGRSVLVADGEFRSATGAPVAHAVGTFVVAPDPGLEMPDIDYIGRHPAPGRLGVPLARRAGCQRRAPGVAAVPRSEDGLNMSRTINGGLLALVAEEAALSLGGDGASLSSLNLSYLAPARVGPAVATATISGGLARVEVRDEGNDGRLCVLGTARLFDRA